MIEGLLLQQRLDAVRDALRLLRRRRAVVLPLMVSALAAGVLAWKDAFGWGHAVWVVPLGALAWTLTARWLAGRKRDSDLELARRVEAAEPDLNARLLTAVEILDKHKGLHGEPPYLERRVIGEALDHEDAQTWIDSVTGRRVEAAARWAALALYLFGVAFLWLVISLRQQLLPRAALEVAVEEGVEIIQETGEPLTFEVTPGAVELELNARLVVEAKITPRAPAEARLVWTDEAGAELGSAEMRAGVDGQTFGAMIPRVSQDLHYHVEAGGERSQAFAVTTFVYPKLERFDVVITPPAHTGLPEREVRNTMKVVAPEFSQLRFKARVNKPVQEAELFGEDQFVIPLTASAEDPLLLEGNMTLERSGRYRLHLVDDQERANEKPPWITLTAQPNALAKIEVVFPKRDLQVSALQELPVEARVWDDIGVSRSGATVTVAGQPKEVVFSHPLSAPNKKLELKELIDLEQEGALPRQLVSYHFWAEDTGPKGEVRRAMSDMFFAQVRPFDDIFRESEPPPSAPGMPGQPPPQAGRLMELQKQIVNATWRIQRDTLAGRALAEASKDVGVVRESQGMALEQTKEQMEETDDAEIKQALTEAWKSMREAIEALEKAEQESQRAALTQALEHEQAALQWLYQASEREHLVTRQNRNQRSSGGGQQERQEQIMNLELKQEEQRYEEESQAMAEGQSPLQQENLEVLNRLKELARRQEALAKKMQELREQMAQAKSEEERQELADQLQRLRQEQEDLLRGLDDLQEKLQQSDNAANLADTREQLEDARQQAFDASEELRHENLTGAANAATRAERELKQMEADFREKTARRFAEEMRTMKRAAQEVARAQQDISEALENQNTTEGAERGDTSNAMERMLNGSEVARQLAEQQERVKDLLDNIRAVSEQAEAGEPVLSRRLYEAARSAQTGGLEEHLQEARLQSRYGNRAEAQDAERKAAIAVEQLARQVDKAAEAVLGSEAEALRMARTELDRLIEEVAKEIEDGQAGQQSQNGQPNPSGQQQLGRDGESGEDVPSPDRERAQRSLAENQGGPGSEEETARQGRQPGPNGLASEQTESAGAEERDSGEGSSGSQMARHESEEMRQGQVQGEGRSGQGDAKQAERGRGGEPGEDNLVAEQQGQAGQQGMAGRQGREGEGQSSQQGQPGQNGQPSSEGQQDRGAWQASAGGQLQEGGAGEPTEAGRNIQNIPEGQRAGGGPRSPNLADRGGAGGGGPDQWDGWDRRGEREGFERGGGWFFDEAAEEVNRRPITGEGFRDWADRLGMVEELLSDPELANEAARISDNARAMRIDHTRSNLPPQVSELGTRIVQPLVELRDRVLEELARKGAENPTVPIDRDPVPPQFKELVRRYYTELGGGR